MIKFWKYELRDRKGNLVEIMKMSNKSWGSRFLRRDKIYINLLDMNGCVRDR